MKTKVNCSGCNHPVELATPESPHILNTEKSTIILLEHPYTGYCEICHKPVALYIAGVNFATCAVPIEAASPIVIPPNAPMPIDISKLKVQSGA